MAKTLKIKDEGDAFEAIEKFLAGGTFPGGIELEGWPKLKIRLVGEKFHSSLTPTVMKSFLELQNLCWR